MKRCKRAVLEDRSIALPDDVLFHILSLLPLKEVVATSVLCKRWRYIWTFVPSLDFSHCKFMIQDKHKFIQMINQVLRLHKGSNLREFRIHYSLDKNSSCYIDSWIAFAIASGVTSLHLNLSLSSLPPFPSPLMTYALPSTFFEKDMGLESYLMRLCPNSSILQLQLSVERFFRSLRDLSLKIVSITDQHLQSILSNCQSLEYLCLKESFTLINIKHAVPLPKLKHLEIYFCRNLENLEIFAKNLVSFKYQGPKINIYLKDARHLVDVSFRTFDKDLTCLAYKNYVFHRLSGYLSQLQILRMDFSHFEAKSGFNDVPSFSNLKLLVLFNRGHHGEEIFLGLTALIKASPLLHRFELHIQSPTPTPAPEERINSRITFGYRHKYLKEVMISRFEGNSSDVEFVNYLLKIAVALKKIEITTNSISFTGGCWYNHKIEGKHGARECAEELRALLPVGVRLEFSGSDD